MRLPADLESLVAANQGSWLVTGAAGFIGSHLVQSLLERDQPVRGLDNLSTGSTRNLDEVKQALPAAQWERFEFVQGDIRLAEDCQSACKDVAVVLHQAALGSVPGSIADPLQAHASNVDGTLNLLLAARDQRVRRLVYASSCAVYGDCDSVPLTEDKAGTPLSPYAATKLINETYAAAITSCYGLPTVGLRYFNVFGPRQDPQGPYAAVIPRWIASLIGNEPVTIHGDGETSRDFCFVANIVQANYRAALADLHPGTQPVFNVGMGVRTSLNQLFDLIRDKLAAEFPHVKSAKPRYGPFREGDIRHSQADLTRAREALNYEPHFRLDQGLEASLDWYKTHLV